MNKKHHQTNDKTPTSARTSEGCNHAHLTPEAIVDAFTPLLCTLARIAAVDVIHSTEKPETLFTRAIMEGEIVYNYIKRVKKGEK